LGTVLRQENKLPEAADALREAIRLQPDFAGAHTTLAAVLRQSGDAAGAAVEAKAGTELAKQRTNEQAALFATNSGKRLMNAGDLDGAISQFRSAIAAKQDYAPAHFQLGLALQRKGEKDEAEKELRRAGDLDPRLVEQ
jgi:Flp pilus assembly protein TadD